MTRKRHKLIWYTREAPEGVNVEDMEAKTNDPDWLMDEARRLAAHFAASDNAECRHDSLEILVLIGDIQAGLREGDISATLAAMYWLGRYVERLGKFRPLEFAAGVGLDRLDDDKAWYEERTEEAEKEGRIHSDDTRREAMELFDRMVKEGHLIKTATAAVKREYNVSPRTLRDWRKKKK